MSRATPPEAIAGRPVGPVAFGMMNLTLFGNIPHEEGIKPLKAALDNGANFWNAGTLYGTPDANSLHLLKYYFTKYPEDASRVVLSVKGAYNGANQTPDCSPEGIRTSVDEALRVLDGLKSIDLFECARVDPKVPIETSIRALAQLVKEGKIGSYGLSEVNAATIRLANAVYPPAAVEVELSLFSRHVLEKGGIADTCRELKIPLLGYSPLDRGWLTGQFKTLDDLPKDDFRRMWPRFQPGAFEQNVKLAEIIEEVAKKKGCTSAQIAIAWVRWQGVLPIPGATKVHRATENCNVVELTDAEAAELQNALDRMEVVGDRYPEMFHEHLNK
ncbi:NADP-dependent oxidoreductase domain-containing protein [Annulohypoxylon maeteangense]|uniref:NADP-dependent oxidoreductase domain-containing protein n=1 Tax=Annulohypoxylon maeteangense TaxID=1927788 RepID=UPI0020087E48|nr:NADP-dependent oxidoreductase domain-containing protein [Annulohypoxylon maeteangense]KAI0886284.1 NADP-dependent oxidoreductase domain-containing protein [Annulohypoxylon maeteangense]